MIYYLEPALKKISRIVFSHFCFKWYGKMLNYSMYLFLLISVPCNQTVLIGRLDVNRWLWKRQAGTYCRTFRLGGLLAEVLTWSRETDYTSNHYGEANLRQIWSLGSKCMDYFFNISLRHLVAMLHRCEKEVLKLYFMWELHEKSWSKITSGFLSGAGCLCNVIITSVVPGFSSRKLQLIQLFMSLRHHRSSVNL